MATYTKNATMTIGSGAPGGNTVHSGMVIVDGNVDQVIANLNTCHFTTRGDWLVEGASAAGRLAVGSRNIDYLKCDANDPVWDTFLGPTTVYTGSVGGIILIAHTRLCSNTGSDQSWNIESAATCGAGYQRIYKLTSSNTKQWDIGTTGSETIDGLDGISLTVQNSCVTLVSDGTNWHIKDYYPGGVFVEDDS